MWDDEIEAYEHVVEADMDYEISDTGISYVPEEFRPRYDAHLYQLFFSHMTVVTPVPRCNPPPSPFYIPLKCITKAPALGQSYGIKISYHCLFVHFFRAPYEYL